MRRCPSCSTLNDAAAAVCQACDRELSHRSPAWQTTLGWVMVWVGFAIAVIDPRLSTFAFLFNAAGWVLYLEDDWVLRVTLGFVAATAMCSIAIALGERFSPLVGSAR